MSTAAASPPGPVVVTSPQRLDLALLRKVSRNPLEALPPEVFDHALVRGWGALGRSLYVMDPELIHDVLVRRAELFAKTPANRRVLGPTLGEGLLVAEGAHWRWQRRAAAPAFQPARLKALAPAMLKAACDTRDRWLGAVGATLRMNHELMATTFAIILATMLSKPEAAETARFETAMAQTLAPVGWMLAVSLARLPRWTPYPGRRRAHRASAHLREVTAALVAEHRRLGAGRPDLLTLLEGAADPQTGRALQDEQLVDNLLTFIAAGHETTAVGLAWTLHLLAAHPQVEARACEEIDRVTGGDEVTPEHLEAMPYLAQVFSEAMRLYPPAPLISRAPREAAELGGASLAAGETVVIPIYALHRNTRLWDDPARFDPDRFGPERSAGRHRLAFMPFGGGPHVCIGSGFAMQEAVAVLAVLLQRLRMRPVHPAAPPHAVMRVTLRPSPELLMRAEPR